jgi:GrpB-like predicted nucleotidyltransferase (UPF0157 family)
MSLYPTELVDVEHIGSTAVPGLQAKPIIDILGGVASMTVADALTEPLCRFGYTTSAELNATLSDRRWFMRWADGHRTHHLHLVVHRSAAWNQRLGFRDALRSDPELAALYGRLKDELAAKHTDNREAYTDAKTAFVLSVVGDA